MGYCNNPDNYFFGSKINFPKQPKEECGMKSCIDCPFYIK